MPPHAPLGLGGKRQPHASIVFLLPKLVCDALDRASPDAERLGHLQDTHALRKLRSHLGTLRSVVLSIFGRPSFTPWATARLRPASVCSKSEIIQPLYLLIFQTVEWTGFSVCPPPTARRCIPKGRASIICRRDLCRRAGESRDGRHELTAPRASSRFHRVCVNAFQPCRDEQVVSRGTQWREQYEPRSKPLRVLGWRL